MNHLDFCQLHNWQFEIAVFVFPVKFLSVESEFIHCVMRANRRVTVYQAFLLLL